MRLAGIELAIADFAARAQQNKLDLEELKGVVARSLLLCGGETVGADQVAFGFNRPEAMGRKRFTGCLRSRSASSRSLMT